MQKDNIFFQQTAIKQLPVDSSVFIAILLVTSLYYPDHEQAIMCSRKLSLFPLVLLLSMQGTSVEAKQLYRWTDEQGKVHYSDIILPKESKYGRARLNEKGITLEEVSAAKTKQQLNQEKRLAILRAEKQRIIAEQLASDRVLLRTFRNTDEIQMALKGKEQTLNLLTRLTHANIKRLKERLSQQQKRAADLEKSGLNVPQTLLTEINATRRQIRENENKIRTHERERERLRHKFKKDKARFIALKKQFKNPSKTSNSVDPQEIVSIVECKNRLECKKAWVWAKRYINQHATTPLQIETDSILMTQKPVTDQDLSLTITLIKGQKEQPSQLFLDTECKPSRIGQELCESPKVKEILAGFPAFINSKK